MSLFDLPYDKISILMDSVVHADGLVAVLSQENGENLLQVYIGENLPQVSAQSLEVITLREFLDRDLNEFTGLMMGFSILDTLRDDLLTKGPSFYPIEQFYLEHGWKNELFHTMKLLAAYVRIHLIDMEYSSTRQRGLVKSFQMALPAILTQEDCQNLVAVIISPDSGALITEKNCELVYNDTREPTFTELFQTIQSKGTLQDRLAALEEIVHYIPEFPDNYRDFVELRPILRLSGQAAILRDNLSQLAWDFYRQRDAKPDFFSVALALMLEFWLAEVEVEDLVAVCPSNDFERFARFGDACLVYRVIAHEQECAITTDVGWQRMSLEQLIHDGLPSGYDLRAFSFPALWPHIPGPPPEQVLDLGVVFFKAGYAHSLARTLILLARDLFFRVSKVEPLFPTYLDSILDMAVRACIIYGLSDPWMWRQGRWSIYLGSSYKTLQQIILTLAEISDDLLGRYYRALQGWYGFSETTDPQANIQAILDQVQELKHALHEYSLRTHDSHLNDQIWRLGGVCESLLRISSGVISVEKDGDEANEPAIMPNLRVPAALREVTDFSAPMPMPSPFFENAWEMLMQARRERQRLYSSEREIDGLVQGLRLLALELQRKRRMLFAPIHERTVLDFAYGKEIEQLETLLRELHSAAKLTIYLRNRWVDQHHEVRLTLEIVNIGRVAAEHLEVILARSRGILLLNSEPMSEIPLLLPGASCQIYYQILPESLDVELRLEYVFRDRFGQKHNDAWTARLNVRSLDEAPFKLKENPYQAGTPIQKPGDFYGRHNELQNILSHLKAGGKQNLLLRGPRRVGKTSLLYMLLLLLTNPTDRVGFEIPQEWYPDLDRIHPVFLSLHRFITRGNLIEVNQFFRSILEGIIRALEVREPLNNNLIRQYQRREKEVGAVNAALEQVGCLLEQFPDERVVVLLDEYDEIYQPGSGGLDRQLREFVSAEQRLTWIIASTQALYQEVKTFSSPWFNVFAILELAHLSEDAAITLVEIPSRKEQVYWRSDAVLALLEETGCHPYFTQLFCSKMIVQLNEQQTNYVLHEMVLRIAERIVDEQDTAHSHFEFYWLDTRGVGRLILLILDDENVPLKRDEIRRRVHALLQGAFGELPRQRIRDSSENLIEWREFEFKNGIDWIEKIVNAISPDEGRRYNFTVPPFHR
jgi:hypothetical protein